MSQNRTIGFQTSSLYRFDPQNGVSERFKSRDLVGDQQGWHPPGRVFFLDAETKQKLTKDYPPVNSHFAYRLYFAEGHAWTPAGNHDNTDFPKGAKPIVSVWDRRTNDCVVAVTASLNPALGRSAVEKTYFENGTSQTHVGSAITRLFDDPVEFEQELQEASRASGVNLDQAAHVPLREM